MPPYPWLIENNLNIESTPSKIRAMQTLGVPYSKGYDLEATNDLIEQALKITASLTESGITVSHEKEIIALIAYLQRLGTDIKVKEAGE